MSTYCPLCGSERCESRFENHSNLTIYECKSENVRVGVMDSALNVNNPKFEFRLKNLICEHYLRNKENYEYTIYYFDEKKDIEEETKKYINLARITYPKTLSERINRVLLNLAVEHSNYGEIFKENDKSLRLFFCEGTSYTELKEFRRLMNDVGVINVLDDKSSYYISPEGWKRIDELQQISKGGKYAFIAMDFSEEYLERRNAIKKGIELAGYIPVIMDEIEHNQQIVPEMLYEIQSSRFLVMESTDQNYGAFYEAGYALGKGKEVIICCKKSKVKTGIHFDIAQQSLVVWETEEDLTERLRRRIEATIQ